MNLSISSQIIEVLDEVCKKIGVTIDWSQENVWPYIQDLMARFIKYKIVTSVLWLIFATISTIISLAIINKIKKKHLKDDDIYATVTVISICIILIFIFVSSNQIDNIIKCIYIPEKIIIDMIKSITRTGG